jgi:isoaspartyl peptidase/L-asparaginase-like protein (Ntn-hydrolase superfamily)
MVLLSAKRLCDLVEDGAELEAAAQRVLAELDSVKGAAGLIALDARGAVVERRNTPFMATARRGG